MPHGKVRMPEMSLIGFLFVGLVAGWLGGTVLRGAGFALVCATIGAVVLPFLFRPVKSA
jgi:uncharacterized membrane protein YeaQ/YmgE (transglycosylase-associated protein family)